MTAASDPGDSTVLGRKTRSEEMPRAAVAVRWTVAVSGLALLCLFLLFRPPHLDAPAFITSAVALVLAQLFFTVKVDAGAYLSIAPAFWFTYLLLAGGTGAALLITVSEVVVWTVFRIRGHVRRTPLFTLFEIGQGILATLFAALVVQFVFFIPALSRPILVNEVSVLVVFAAVWLLVHTILSSIAVYALTGFSEVRHQLWPGATLWLGISFLITFPFAIVLRVLTRSIAYPLAALLVFSVLGGIAWIVRLNVDLRSGNEELKAINRIGTLVSATLDLAQLFRILARESRRVLPWDAFFIALGGKESEQIDLIFMTAEGSEIAQRKIARGAGLTGRAIATGELVFYDQSHKASEVAGETFRGRRTPKSIVVAPMLFGEEVIGAISVQSYRSDVYGASRFRLLQTIAAQAAIAIRNAQLFESEERANRERDEFVSLITHEIKNPLTSITGYASLAADSIAREETAPTLESIKVIEGEAAKILRLLEDLLDASKLSAGKFSMAIEEVDLAEIVRTVARKYEMTSTHHFHVEIPPSVSRIEGDPTRLTQVVENLVSNAVKYSARDGEIRVALSSVDAGTVALRVSDTGRGIPESKVPLLFERFFRVEEDSRSVKGTGLGLFITREIVRMHGGTVDVESTEGVGSTFTVRLPIRRASEPTA